MSQFTQPPNVCRFHPPILCLPLVICRIADFVLATNVSYRPSRFHCFQDRDDLMLTEFAPLHSWPPGLAILPGNLYFSMVLFLGVLTWVRRILQVLESFILNARCSLF